MDRHAGFAVAVCINEALLSRLIQALYFDKAIAAEIDFSTGRLTGSIFIEPPEIQFLRANGNLVSVGVRGWGPLEVRDPNYSGGILTRFGSRLATFEAEILVELTAQAAAGQLSFQVNSQAAQLRMLTIERVIYPFSNDDADYLASDELRLALQGQIQKLLSLLALLLPMVPMTVLGDIGNDSNPAAVTLRVLDRVIALGIDLVGGSIQTTGDPGQLFEFDDHDLALWLNPISLPIAFAPITHQIAKIVEKNDASLDALSMGLEEGGIRVVGTASAYQGSVDFSLLAVPRLVRPGTAVEFDDEYGEHFRLQSPDRDEVWFEHTEVEIDINRPWWVYIADAIGAGLAGIGTAFVEGFFAGKSARIATGILDDSQSFQPRQIEILVSGSVRTLRIELLQAHSEGLFMALSLQLPLPKPELLGVGSLAVEEVAQAAPIFRPFARLPTTPFLNRSMTASRQ